MKENKGARVTCTSASRCNRRSISLVDCTSFLVSAPFSFPRTVSTSKDNAAESLFNALRGNEYSHSREQANELLWEFCGKKKDRREKKDRLERQLLQLHRCTVYSPMTEHSSFLPR